MNFEKKLYIYIYIYTCTKNTNRLFNEIMIKKTYENKRKIIIKNKFYPQNTR